MFVIYARHRLVAEMNNSIVEFASPEDAQRAVRELSEQPLLGRPVFIREVLFHDTSILGTWLTSTHDQDRENESRFGATPVPGKIGMAMAGQGLNAAPPPRPAYHNTFGGGPSNPGNQLYVGNVSPIHVYYFV
jgi:RNA recognition motif-containing protein